MPSASLHRLLFDAVCTGDSPGSDEKLSQLIIQWERLFHDMGRSLSYGAGSHGNLSIQTKEGCFISATQTFLGAITELQFVQIIGCDMGASPSVVRYKGEVRPSTDSLIHWQVYQARPGVACVLHAHDAQVLRVAECLGLPQKKPENWRC